MSEDLTEGFVCSNLSDDLSGLSFKEIPIEKVSENFVKIDIKAASLNFPDLLMTQGKYQNKPELPFALGMEGSGVISQMGSDVKNYKIGDEVMFGGNGTHADYHKPTDTVEKIRYDLLAQRAQLVFYTAWELANREQRIVVDNK